VFVDVGDLTVAVPPTQRNLSDTHGQISVASRPSGGAEDEHAR